MPAPPTGWVEVPTQATPSDAGVDRDGRGTDLGEACAKLRALGCPEGEPDGLRTCYQHLLFVSAVFEVPSACVRLAPDVATLRACRGPEDVRFRCLKGDAGP